MRGRPKGSKNKNHISLFDNSIDVKAEQIFEEREPEQKEEKKVKKSKYLCTCELCSKEVENILSINLSILTSKATWHRKCKIEKIKICNKCAEEFNKCVDEWILKKNPALNKWNG